MLKMRLKKTPLLVLPILWVFFSIMLVFTNFLPDRLVKASIAGGIQEAKNEGDHPSIFFTPQSKLDNFTDQIMMQQCQRTSNWNSITSRFATKQEWHSLESNALHNPLNAAFSNQGYSRYWHGYTVFLKPLLIVFNYSAIRTLFFLLFGILLCLAFDKIRQRFGIFAACALLISIVVANFFVVPMSLVFSPVFYVTLMCVIGIDYFKRTDNRVLLFLIVGAVTNYVDFLTVPMLTLCIPLAFVVAYDAINSSCSAKACFISMIRSGLAWLLGYASTWGIKWMLSSLVLHKNIIADAIQNILIRSDSGGVNEAKGMSFNRGDVIQANYQFMFDQIPLRLSALILISLICVLLYRFLKYGGDVRLLYLNFKKASPLLIIGCAPVVWYSALVNHSSIHMEFYAYKNVAISILCSLLFFVLLFLKPDDKVSLNEAKMNIGNCSDGVSERDNQEKDFSE